LSEQETNTEEEVDNTEEEVDNAEEATKEGENQRTEDPIGDLSELDKIKKELEAEKAKAAKELEEGEEDQEDLREVDYLQKLVTLSVQFDQNVGFLFTQCSSPSKNGQTPGCFRKYIQN